MSAILFANATIAIAYGLCYLQADFSLALSNENGVDNVYILYIYYYATKAARNITLTLI